MSFTFVNFSNPGQTEHGAFKKQVRSAAAAYSHRVAPRKGLKAARYKQRPQSSTTAASPADRKSSSGDSTNTTAANSPALQRSSSAVSSKSSRSSSSPKSAVPSPVKRIKTEPASKEPIARVRSRSPSPFRPTSRHAQLQSLQGAIGRIHDPPLARATPKANMSKKRSRSRSLHHPENFTSPITFNVLPDPCFLDASRKDPFETYPVPFQPWFGWLLDFWYACTLPRARRLIKTDLQSLQNYVVWSRRFELTEPALFYTSLFLATGIPVANGQMHVEKALWLRGQAVRALNEALDDPERATSNALISAVGKIALHEHIYGDRQASIKIHRPAQQRMIALRGGVEALGLPSITLQLMTWYDTLMAAETGTVAYFKDVPKKLALQSFTNEEAVRVTNESSPHRYRHPGYGTTNSDPGKTASASASSMSSNVAEARRPDLPSRWQPRRIEVRSPASAESAGRTTEGFKRPVDRLHVQKGPSAKSAHGAPASSNELAHEQSYDKVPHAASKSQLSPHDGQMRSGVSDARGSKQGQEGQHSLVYEDMTQHLDTSQLQPNQHHFPNNSFSRQRPEGDRIWSTQPSTRAAQDRECSKDGRY